MKKVHVMPVTGRSIRDPRTRKHLPLGGLVVVLTAYWLRRLADGDVVEGPVDVPGPREDPGPREQHGPREDPGPREEHGPREQHGPHHGHHHGQKR